MSVVRLPEWDESVGQLIWAPGLTRSGIVDTLDARWIVVEMSHFILYGAEGELESPLPPDYVFPWMVPEWVAIDLIELLCLTIKKGGTDETKQALSDLLARVAL